MSTYYTNARRDMLPFLPEKPVRTIEFGCGNGLFSTIIKERFNAETWGVDISNKAVAEASKVMDHVFEGDAVEVLNELPEGYFDCLICNDILEHLADPEDFLIRVRRIMSENAFITCSVPNVRSWGNFIRFFVYKDWKYTDSGTLDRTHLRFFTKKSLVRTLQNCKIAIETIKGITPTRTLLFNLANIISFGFIADMRYLEFAVRGKFKG